MERSTNAGQTHVDEKPVEMICVRPQASSGILDRSTRQFVFSRKLGNAQISAYLPFGIATMPMQAARHAIQPQSSMAWSNVSPCGCRPACHAASLAALSLLSRSFPCAK